jgi:hypothetical protein
MALRTKRALATKKIKPKVHTFTKLRVGTKLKTLNKKSSDLNQTGL